MNELKETLKKYRENFHLIPEPSYKEYETSQTIQDHLENLKVGFELVGKTAIVAKIGKGKPYIGIRFNMDGLQGCSENTNLAFKSKNLNCMHACGHDVEMAWGLALADYFSRNLPKGTLHLIFQPAEEGPGDDEKGRDGGKYLSEEGVFNKLSALLSLHVDPALEPGYVCAAPGIATVGAIDFTFNLLGKSSHLSRPQEGENPIWNLPIILNDIHKLREEIIKEASEFEWPYYLVLDASQISAGLDLQKPLEAEINTLPNHAVVKGSSRILGNNTKQSLINGLEKIAIENKVELILNEVAIETYNDPVITTKVKEAIVSAGYQYVEEVKYWKDAAGWTARNAPVCHGYVGCGNQSGQLHTSNFYPNDEVLLIGFTVLKKSINNLFEEKNISIE